MSNANLPVAEKRDRGSLLQAWPWKSPCQRPAAGARGTPRAAVQIAGAHPAARQGEQHRERMIILEDDREGKHFGNLVQNSCVYS